jgi:hypothetical protein
MEAGMHRESFPARYPVAERFPAQRVIRAWEGGGLCTAEHDGKFYLIVDESTMAAFLDVNDPTDREVLNRLVTVMEFDSELERRRFADENYTIGVPLDEPR